VTSFRRLFQNHSQFIDASGMSRHRTASNDCNSLAQTDNLSAINYKLVSDKGLEVDNLLNSRLTGVSWLRRSACRSARRLRLRLGFALGHFDSITMKISWVMNKSRWHVCRAGLIHLHNGIMEGCRDRTKRRFR
jgi:hypothetical protein